MRSFEEFGKELKRQIALVEKFENAIKKDTQVYLDSQDIEYLFDYYATAKNYDKVEYLISLGERLHGDDDDIRMLRPILLYEQKQYEKALQILDMLNLHGLTNWHFNRAKVLEKLGRTDEARKEAEYIMQNNKEDLDKFALDITPVFLENHPEIARQFLLKGLQYNSQNEEVLNGLAFIASMQGDDEEALSYLDKIIDLQPYEIPTWVEKGNILATLNRFDEALEAFEYALAINPKHHYSSLTKAQLLIEKGELDQAIDYLAQLQKDIPQIKYRCMALQADIMYVKQDYAAACRLYRPCFMQQIGAVESMIRYVEAKMKLARWKDALKICLTLLENFPEEVELLEQAANIYVELNRKDLAAKYLRKCIRLEPDNAHFLVLYGGLMLELQDIKTGARYIRKAYRQAPDNFLTNLMMAVTYAQIDNAKKVKQHLTTAMNLDKNAIELFLKMFPEGEQYVQNLTNT